MQSDTQASAYPVQFSVEYADRDLDRVTKAFRLIWAIPIAILVATIQGGPAAWETPEHGSTAALSGTALLFVPPLLMILFRQKYPRWWFDWNLELMRFMNRVCVYVGLMDDRYPSTDEQQSVLLEFPYPDPKNGLNRWLPIVKWALAIPHFIVLFFLSIGAFLAVVGAWFAILFTGRYPRGLFDFVLGVLRWWNRVIAYAFALVTDEYPPFRLAA
jgi:Domain of unknown function (DUF4389)